VLTTNGASPLCYDQIGPMDRLPIRRLSDQRRRGIPTLQACILGIEVENEIKRPIFVDIFKSSPHGTRFSAGFPKADSCRVHRRGIQPGRRQDGHRDYLDSVGISGNVDPIRELAGLDVEVGNISAIWITEVAFAKIANSGNQINRDKLLTSFNINHVHRSIF
jgi:hypothetical protein